MLHILAHSLYKAHAFLSSGNVIAERSGLDANNTLNLQVGPLKFAMSAVGIMAFLWTVLTLFGIDPVQKPGGLLLGGILGMALTQWVTQVMRSGSRRLVLGAVSSAAGLCIVYATSFFMVDWIVATSLPRVVPSNPVWLVAMMIVTGFMGMFVLQFMLAKGRRNASLNRWYIHASNGFYVDSVIRRVFGPLVYS
jgi:NAD(P)H-quinone oxidoreductase subunit 5